MRKTSQFKDILASVMMEPMYELSGNGTFENMVLAGLGKSGQNGPASLSSISKGFLVIAGPAFVMEQAIFKTGKSPDRSIIESSLSKLFSDERKLDAGILSALSGGRFAISVDVNEERMTVDLSKLLRFAFGEALSVEMKAVLGCLRNCEKSQILKQININEYQTGESLRKYFEKDAQDAKNGSRNSDKLEKFLERMEQMGAMTKEGFSQRRYS